MDATCRSSDREIQNEDDVMDGSRFRKARLSERQLARGCLAVKTLALVCLMAFTDFRMMVDTAEGISACFSVYDIRRANSLSCLHLQHIKPGRHTRTEPGPSA